ncbi:MAG: flavodoxin family protein [Thermodesulfovibrionales bacterium]|nr:flavodoxin family protein [Thermodesulfovibrionales bacterium]
MKAIAFNGSARIEGNTAYLLKIVLAEIAEEGIETELYHLADKPIQGCVACYRCFKNKNKRCANNQDIINECICKMLEANAILLGSPTYFSNVSACMKALIERTGMVARANDDMFKRKVGAGIVAVRRAGAIHVFSSLNYFFLIAQMIVPGSSYWNIAIGRELGEVQKDLEGIQTMKTLGQNIAWLMKKLYS